MRLLLKMAKSNQPDPYSPPRRFVFLTPAVRVQGRYGLFLGNTKKATLSLVCLNRQTCSDGPRVSGN